jgi:density-regulated protein
MQLTAGGTIYPPAEMRKQSQAQTLTWMMESAVLRVWWHYQEVRGMASEEPPWDAQEVIFRRYMESMAAKRTTYQSDWTLSAEALSANLSALSVDAQKRAEKDAAKKTAKAAAAEQRESERKAEAIVLIKRIERNKRKYVTVVSGLEEHGLDLKKVAKELGKKFATGSSVTKTAAGGEEITVQGDVSDDLYDWLQEKYPDIPEDNLDMKDETKKKGGSWDWVRENWRIWALRMSGRIWPP